MNEAFVGKRRVLIMVLARVWRFGDGETLEYFAGLDLLVVVLLCRYSVV